MAMTGDRTAQLEERLGYRFADHSLLATALTHPSLAGGVRNGRTTTYQRLEFLCDRVLALVIAELLYRSYPEEAEGSLAKRLTGLVRMETLAEVAAAIDLGEAVRMSESEALGGGKSNPNILADVCEAVIGALYLDGGLEAAQYFVLTHWRPLLETATTPPQDPKSALQEWAQRRGLPLPEYTISAQEGPPHDPVFTVMVSVHGHGSRIGKGPSKRAGEKAAAENLLAALAEEA